MRARRDRYGGSAVRLLSWWSRLVVVVTAGALLVTAVVVAIGPRLWRIANAHDEVPVSLPPTETIADRTYVYDRAGNEIAAYELENSQPVSITEVPDDVITAVLAVEDREFYRHHGVNVRSLFRASLSNFEGGARQGASTISQQVAKVDYLAGLERDGRYKLLQILYALRLEKVRTKEQILERYLNTIYLGNNAYGIKAAAEVYFGKSVGELTLVDGAFLAGLIQAPTSYDPIRRPEPSRRRFVEVLGALVDEGMMTRSDADAVIECLEPREAPTEAEKVALDARCEGSWQIPEVVKSIQTKAIERTHFSEEVKSFLLNRSDILGTTYEERYYRLFRGGLKIYTTLDPVVQAAADKAKAEQLPTNSAGIEAAVVTLDSKSGAVRAMVGGKPFEAGRNELNLALSTRQTGSSIKIFVLAAAVQAGVQNDDLLDGTLPCVLPNPDDPDNPFVIGEGVSRSVGPLEEMTWYSINCAFSRLALITGLDRVVDTTYRMASSSYLYPGQSTAEREPIRPYASFATGANEMSPLDMAAGAQTLANGGLHFEPFFVERIEGPSGVIYQHQSAGTQVLTPDVAARTTSILEGVLVSGTARRSALEGRVAAGKTGTQDNNTNAWFVGFTPELTTAVWVGHPDKYLPMNDIPEFSAVGVPRVQGGTFPAAIWKATMDAALLGVPASGFPAPPDNSRSPMRLVLPGVDCPVPTTLPMAEPVDTSSPVVVVEPTTTTRPPRTTTTTLPEASSITTVPRGVVDPTWPVPTIDPEDFTVERCATAPTAPPTIG
jgi:penicillin-binding protein 1A